MQNSGSATALSATAAFLEMESFYELLRSVSRTFALSIEQLPPVLRDPFTIAYLLLRVSDTLEDHPALDADRKEKLLLLWDAVLEGSAPVRALDEAVADVANASEDWQAVRRAPEILSGMENFSEPVREIITRYVRETTRGMARWQRTGPVVSTVAEMDDYMHQVAGLVGYMITELFAWYSPAIAEREAALLPLGREFGLGLQAVNVIRGLRSDFRRGWVFVPESLYTSYGLRAEDLFDPAHRAQALQVVEDLAAKAERHLDAGLRYVHLLPRRQHRLRLMCIWPLLFAARTLAISRGNPAVLAGQAKITRAEVKRIMRRGAALGWSNRWLTMYYKQLLRPAGNPQRGTAAEA